MRRTLSFEPQEHTALLEELEALRGKLREGDAGELARRCGAALRETGGGAAALELEYLGAPVRVPFPELAAYRSTGEPLPLPVQAVLIYYLATTNGAPLSGTWVSFADLPGGRMYARAFQGYAGDKLARKFGNEIEPFRRACEAAGGQAAALGDAAYTFAALPRVPLLITYWLGEDEFPPACKVLFDASAANHLPVDVCAILGSMLVGKVLKAA